MHRKILNSHRLCCMICFSIITTEMASKEPRYPSVREIAHLYELDRNIMKLLQWKLSTDTKPILVEMEVDWDLPLFDDFMSTACCSKLTFAVWEEI